jgi:hypothetical protein
MVLPFIRSGAFICFTYFFMYHEQIVATVDIEGKKSCYIWNLLAKEISVLDPSLMNSQKQRIKRVHEKHVVNLTAYLCEGMKFFYPHWEVDKFDMEIVYINDVSRAARGSVLN